MSTASTFDEVVHTFDETLDLLQELDFIEPGVWDYAAPTALTARALVEEISKPDGERDLMMVHALLVVWQHCEPAVRSRFTESFAAEVERWLYVGVAPEFPGRLSLCLTWIEASSAPTFFCAAA